MKINIITFTLFLISLVCNSISYADNEVVVDNRDITGETQLIKAVKEHDQALTINLLQLNSEQIDHQDQNGDTALIIATRNGDMDIMYQLVKAGADFNIRNNEGDNALLVASKNNNFAIIEYLVAQGADLSRADNTSRTALAFAIFNSNYEASLYLMRAIIQDGIDFTLYDDNGETLLHHAAKKGMYPIVKFLLAAGAMEEPNQSGDTALHSAIISKSLPVIKLLLKEDFDIDWQGENGNTPLMYATYANMFDVVSFLLQKGADITLKNSDGNTALHLAIDKQSLASVKEIVKVGQATAEFIKNSSNNAGYTPIQLADYYRENFESGGEHLAPIVGQIIWVFEALGNQIDRNDSEDLRNKIYFFLKDTSKK